MARIGNSDLQGEAGSYVPELLHVLDAGPGPQLHARPQAGQGYYVPCVLGDALLKGISSLTIMVPVSAHSLCRSRRLASC